MNSRRNFLALSSGAGLALSMPFQAAFASPSSNGPEVMLKDAFKGGVSFGKAQTNSQGRLEVNAFIKEMNGFHDGVSKLAEQGAKLTASGSRISVSLPDMSLDLKMILAA